MHTNTQSTRYSLYLTCRVPSSRPVTATALWPNQGWWVQPCALPMVSKSIRLITELCMCVGNKLRGAGGESMDDSEKAERTKINRAFRPKLHLTRVLPPQLPRNSESNGPQQPPPDPPKGPVTRCYPTCMRLGVHNKKAPFKVPI